MKQNDSKTEDISPGNSIDDWRGENVPSMILLECDETSWLNFIR